jgi:sugar (pentulose or hexulose) kinase
MIPTRFLGLDLSTQSLTAVLIDLSGEEIQQFSINFDETYPAYGTAGGVITGDDPTVVYADPRMWIAAVDDMLTLLNATGFTPRIRSIGVSAQQHGSVYLKANAADKLAHLDAAARLTPQLDGIFFKIHITGLDGLKHPPRMP